MTSLGYSLYPLSPDAARLMRIAPQLLELAKLVAQHTYPRGHRARITKLACDLIAKAEGQL